MSLACRSGHPPRALRRALINATVGVRHRQFSSGSCGDGGEKFRSVDPNVRYPAQYFDFAAFRKALASKKQLLAQAEFQAVKREYAKPPPKTKTMVTVTVTADAEQNEGNENEAEGDSEAQQTRQELQYKEWDVLRFMQEMKLADDEIMEEIAACFENWQDFVSLSSKDLLRIPQLTSKQRRRLLHYLNLFNHGLWPEAEKAEYLRVFDGQKAEFQGKPWTHQEDQQLLELCEYWDVNFGDPWIYISADMKRGYDEVRERYVEIVLKEKQSKQKCELAMTLSTRPLLMNRQFRMLPSQLYVVPTEKNFPLNERKDVFKLPKNLQRYRDPENFASLSLDENVGEVP